MIWIAASERGKLAETPLSPDPAGSPRAVIDARREENRRSRMTTYTMTIDGIVQAPVSLHVESGRRYVLGRASDAAFQLPETDRRISRYHAAVEGTLGGIRIQDLGSSNGTFVNGTQVDAAVLRPGDRVRIGKTVLAVGKLDSLVPPPPPSRRSGPVVPGVQAARDAWTAWTDTGVLTCGSCGASWPAAAQDENSGCSACQPRRPLGDADPRKIGSFDILCVIGAGPRSRVYEARNRFTGKRTALKRLVSKQPEERAAWLDRAREDASLHHPRIARTCETVSDRETGEVGVSMEWLLAGNCRKLAGPQLSVAAALLLGADLFDALIFLHAFGLVHGGVKPDNLLIHLTESQQWRGKLSDHGCHDPAGTPGFTAPELLGADRLPTPATDVYSAAATVYFLLTGTVPSSDSARDTALAGAASTRVSLAARRSDAPKELVELLDSALLPDPAARPTAHAGEIALQLRRIAQSLPKPP